MIYKGSQIELKGYILSETEYWRKVKSLWSGNKKLTKEFTTRLGEAEKIESELKAHDLSGFKRTARSWRSISPYEYPKAYIFKCAFDGEPESALLDNLKLFDEMVRFLESINHSMAKSWRKQMNIANTFVNKFFNEGEEKAFEYYVSVRDGFRGI